LLRKILGEDIPKSSLSFFCEQCAAMIGAGFSIERAIERASQVGDPEIAQMGESMRPMLAAGAPLTRALAPFKDRLPPLVMPLVEVGEESGTLESQFRRLASAFRKDAGFELRYQFEVFNPWLVMLVIVLQAAAFGFIGGVVAGLIIGVMSFVKIALLYIVSRHILRALNHSQSFRRSVDTVKIAIPGLGTVARYLAIARWGRSFATLWAAGVSVSHALEISSRSALNGYYERIILTAAAQTRQGMPLSQCLAGTQMLPPYLLAYIITGEESGKLSEAVYHMADQLEMEALYLAQQHFQSITVALQILSAVMVFGMLSI
jgi:type IV pilus assembly protein PilC